MKENKIHFVITLRIKPDNFGGEPGAQILFLLLVCKVHTQELRNKAWKLDRQDEIIDLG